MRITAILVAVIGAVVLVLIGCGSDSSPTQPMADPDPDPEPVSGLILDRSMHNEEFEIVSGGWQCLFHADAPPGLQLRHIESGAAWELHRDDAWRDLEPGVYQLVVPDAASGVIGSCGRVGTSVERLRDAAEAAASQEAAAAESQAAAAESQAAAAESQAAAVEQAIETARAEGEAAGRTAGRVIGHREGRAEGRAEAQAQQSQRSPAWVDAAVNPDEPAACTDPRTLRVRGIPASDGSTIFELRVAVRFRDDGVAWAAVEDNADWPTACHVYSVEDWTYNPETGWMHSGPIRVVGY